jgi:hypothetical protein
LLIHHNREGIEHKNTIQKMDSRIVQTLASSAVARRRRRKKRSSGKRNCQ